MVKQVHLFSCGFWVLCFAWKASIIRTFSCVFLEDIFLLITDPTSWWRPREWDPLCSYVRAFSILIWFDAPTLGTVSPFRWGPLSRQRCAFYLGWSSHSAACVDCLSPPLFLFLLVGTVGKWATALPRLSEFHTPIRSCHLHIFSGDLAGGSEEKALFLPLWDVAAASVEMRVFCAFWCPRAPLLASWPLGGHYHGLPTLKGSGSSSGGILIPAGSSSSLRGPSESPGGHSWRPWLVSTPSPLFQWFCKHLISCVKSPLA